MGVFSRITEIKTEADLIGPGAAPGTIPTDLDQATGLDRLEILGKMQGIDVFDMKPLDASRKGADTLPNKKNRTIVAIWGGGGDILNELMLTTLLCFRHARQPYYRQVRR